MSLIPTSRRLARTVNALKFQGPVHTVYNPLDYAKAPHEAYLERFGTAPKEVLLVGMNPGPFGMAQTGVPFGDVSMVRDFMGIHAPVRRPKLEHPKRPIQGFDCPKSEVSGTRLWGWAKQRYRTAERFFARFFVINYCPLCFMEEGGKNLTPDKLPKHEQGALFAACDRALADAIEILQPRACVGVGAFATRRLREVVGGRAIRVSTMLHPSPASPKANRGWAAFAEADLRAAGIKL